MDENLEQDKRLERIGNRCFAIFVAYFVAVSLIAIVGSSQPQLQPALTCIILGSSFTSGIYLRAGRKTYEELSKPKAIRWPSGRAMSTGVWVMAITGILALMLAESGD